MLFDYQRDAVNRMHNGCILCGGVGSGKSITSIAYFSKCMGGDLDGQELMNDPLDLYIITTAKKRDSLDWEWELQRYGMSLDPKLNYYKSQTITVDSWNNISKYSDVQGAFFIFDEQRVVGYGSWAKSFINIARHNQWILLSATPGDTWQDYCAVFIANGFYKNKSEFEYEHVVYKRYVSYPVVDRFINEGRLIRLRNKTLINMDFERSTESHHEAVPVEYDRDMEKFIFRTNQNPYDDFKPCRNAAEFCQALRRLVNTDPSRQEKLLDIVEDHKKVIIFYNYNYELDILRSLPYRSEGYVCDVAEYNGCKHEPIPDSDHWVYLVQYTAGAEGWNCIATDTIVFYSENYSYKIMEQSAGRINRLNTQYHDLYYYHFISHAKIDQAIQRALKRKKKFNEGKFYTGGN